MDRIRLALVLVFLIPTTGYAQGVKPYIAGAIFDWSSTYLVRPPGTRIPCDRDQAAENTCRRTILEGNPLIGWIHPTKVQAGVAAGADALTVWGLHKLLATRHPRELTWGLRVATGLRVSLGVWNLYGVKR